MILGFVTWTVDTTYAMFSVSAVFPSPGLPGCNTVSFTWGASISLASVAHIFLFVPHGGCDGSSPFLLFAFILTHHDHPTWIRGKRSPKSEPFATRSPGKKDIKYETSGKCRKTGTPYFLGRWVLGGQRASGVFAAKHIVGVQ